jgi:hypothetical protein
VRRARGRCERLFQWDIDCRVNPRPVLAHTHPSNSRHTSTKANKCDGREYRATSPCGARPATEPLETRSSQWRHVPKNHSIR